MKTHFYLCFAWVLVSFFASAQNLIQSPNGLTFPSFTTSQRDTQLSNSLNGTVIFNSTTNLLELRTGNIWKSLALPTCYSETIAPTSKGVYKFTSGNSTIITDITPTIPINNVVVYGLPSGVTYTITPASPVYHVNFAITPSSAVVSNYPVSIMTSSNCGLSNVSTFSLSIYNCPYTNCGGNCIYLLADTSNCGACGNIAPSHPNALKTCVNGIPGFTCNAGFTNCGGTCINLSTYVNNCGACGNVAPTHANAVTTCVNGSPVFTCNTGFTNCGGTCINLSTNANNCGVCGKACPIGHSCVNGVCN